MKKLLLTTALIACCLTSLLAQPCLPEGIHFFSQEMIDNFQTNYPGCTEIEGDVIIDGQWITNLNGLNVLTSIGGDMQIACENITNLNGLNVLTSIAGSLKIGYFDIFPGTLGNPALVILTGLDNLTSIGENLLVIGNDALINLTGLGNLTSIGGDLAIGSSLGNNPSLISLTGLDNLTSIGGSLYISFNPMLSSLTDLSNLTEFGGEIEIWKNNSIENLIGLENVTVAESVNINENESLVSLDGINNIDAGSLQWIQLVYNTNLSTCEVESICDYLASPNGTIYIFDNATGCNSQQEVQEACDSIQTNIVESRNENVFTLSPNPLESNAVITYTLNEISHVSLNILDLSGREIETLINEVQQQGEQRIEFNANGLPAGIYFSVLKTNEGIQTKKIIKL